MSSTGSKAEDPYARVGIGGSWRAYIPSISSHDEDKDSNTIASASASASVLFTLSSTPTSSSFRAAFSELPVIGIFSEPHPLSAYLQKQQRLLKRKPDQAFIFSIYVFECESVTELTDPRHVGSDVIVKAQQLQPHLFTTRTSCVQIRFIHHTREHRLFIPIQGTDNNNNNNNNNNNKADEDNDGKSSSVTVPVYHPVLSSAGWSGTLLLNSGVATFEQQRTPDSTWYSRISTLQFTTRWTNTQTSSSSSSSSPSSADHDAAANSVDIEYELAQKDGKLEMRVAGKSWLLDMDLLTDYKIEKGKDK